MSPSWRYYIHHLILGLYLVLFPTGAVPGDNQTARFAHSGAASADMTEFPSLELVVLVGVVLLALVVIARSGKAP